MKGKFQNEQAEALWSLVLEGLAYAEAVDPVGTWFSFFPLSSYEGVVLGEDSQGFVWIADCSPHEWDEVQAEWADMESDDI